MEVTMLRKFFENKMFIVSSIVLLLFILLAVFARWISPHDPLTLHAKDALKLMAPGYLMGTDEYGRDILSRLIYGLQPSLMVAAGSTCIAFAAGLVLGVIAGYVGGLLDQSIMRIIDIIMCFPAIILTIMIVTFWGSGVFNLTIAIGIIFTPSFARLAYSSTLQIRHQEYIDAQISLGAGVLRILFTGILPNILSPLIVQFSLTFGRAILLESGLSFLGLGVVPPAPSLGAMIGEAQGYLQQNPMFLIWPSLALAIIVVFINLFGDSLRDILDPRVNE